MTTLYRKQASGSLGTWRIWRELDQVRIAHAIIEGGQEVFHTEKVVTNQSGRSLEEQINLRIKSRISRALDKGYKYTREDALAGSSNQLGLLRPMLAKQFNKVTKIDYIDAVLQKKLDGHRCMITKQDGEILAYSRQGKIIDTIPHITDYLYHRIPEGTTIDGELYLHGFKLQTLASWIKRKQKDTERLMFVSYDIVSPDTYLDRHQELLDIVTNMHSHVKVLGIKPFETVDKMWDYFHQVRDEGFEGLMLRTRTNGYEAGPRSSSLIKVKAFEDDEFLVKDLRPSKEGWAICQCETKDGQTFGVSAPGSKDEKLYVMRNPAKFIGRYLTVDYSHLTNDGIPFHPTATRWREDV